jgi:RNA polymerase sigma-70 factor, ECF subfamily
MERLGSRSRAPERFFVPDDSDKDVALALRLENGLAATRESSPGWAELYDRHAQSVARWAQRLGGPTVDTEDVVQEVFLTVHRSLPRFRGDAKVTTWLYRITENVVRHRRRKDRQRGWVAGTPEQVAGELPATEASPLDDIERRQATAKVYRAMEGMSEKLRSALILFELEQLSGEEIAALTGAKTSTVWVWLHRARAEFQRRLQEIEKTEERV